MFDLKVKPLGHFDIAVAGAGVAGICAAISAARAGSKVVLIERGGSIGGTLTEGFMPNLIDADNKGGIVKELFDFLNERSMTCTKRGNRTDEEGNIIPGRMVDTEGCKYFFDKTARDAGVEVLFYSQVAACEMDGDRISSILLVTECGNYSLSADVYVDATGNGLLSDLAGCKWECGDPEDKRPSPTSVSLCAVGMPSEYNGTDSAEEKAEYGAMLERNGISTSAEYVSVKKLPSLMTWDMGTNFQYDVTPDDIRSLSRAVTDGRREAFEVIEAHKRIPGYDRLRIAFTGAHIGVREGRRVYGEDRISDEDIIEAARRELREETGAIGGELIPLGTLYPSVAIFDEKIHMFAAVGFDMGETDRDEDEFMEVEKIPLSTLVDMVMSGEIRDAKTQTAVLKAARLVECSKIKINGEK